MGIPGPYGHELVCHSVTPLATYYTEVGLGALFGNISETWEALALSGHRVIRVAAGGSFPVRALESLCCGTVQPTQQKRTVSANTVR